MFYRIERPDSRIAGAYFATLALGSYKRQLLLALYALKSFHTVEKEVK